MNNEELVKQAKERFLEIARKNIKRDGIEEFLKWLETTDFFTAPASTVFHGNYEGGLCLHSLNVFEELSKSPYVSGYDIETITFVSLFHDVCKTFTYVTEMRNTKDERGNWIKVPFFKTDIKYPFGHGEKSVYLLMKNGFGTNISDEEALAIDWHMGGFDMRAKGGSYESGSAFSSSILATELHIADMRATHVVEPYKK